MKPFLVFKWNIHLPSGGWDDLEAQFDTFAEVENHHKEHPLQWAQVRQVVFEGDVLCEWDCEE